MRVGRRFFAAKTFPSPLWAASENSALCARAFSPYKSGNNGPSQHPSSKEETQVNGTIFAKGLFWLLVFSASLLAKTDIPAGFVEIDCLCRPGDTMSKAALRSTGRAGNYRQLLAVHPRTLKVLRTKNPADYKRLALGTKIYAPESMAVISASFDISGMSVLQICQHRLGGVPLDDCVEELVRLNSINTCGIRSLVRPLNGPIFIPSHFLLTTGLLPGRQPAFGLAPGKPADRNSPASAAKSPPIPQGCARQALAQKMPDLIPQ